MSQFADQMVVHRKLLRSVRLWRFIAFGVLLFGALYIGALMQAGTKNSAITGSPYIARLTISGVITGKNETITAIDEIIDSKNVKGVILHIQSPGGTTSGAELLYEKLRELSAKKPMVAYVDHMAASGGYIVALSADHIVAQQNALVGSIGVLVQWTEFAGLMKTIGVKMEEVKSAPLKAAPNGFELASDDAKNAMKDIVLDSYAWFKNLVKIRRNIDDTGLNVVSDGRIFTGRQALANKLVDSIGQESVAKQWLIDKNQLDKTLKIEDWENKRDWKDQFEEKISHFSKIMGLNGILGTYSGSNQLDGLVSVWNPQHQ